MDMNPSALEQEINRALKKHISSKTKQDQNDWWAIFKHLHSQRSAETVRVMEKERGLS